MNTSSATDRIGSIQADSLNAYIDAELDAQRMLDLQREVPGDATASGYVEDIRSMQAMLRTSLDEVGRQPPSRGLEQTLRRLKHSQHQAPRSSLLWGQPVLAAAAGLALLAIGFGSGLFTANQQLDRRLSALENARNQTLSEVDQVLNQVLENSPSGHAVAWRSGRYDASAELTPIRTLKTPDQRYCREYQETLLINGEREERRGLSCRTGKAQWEKQLIVAPAAKALF